MHHRDTVHMWYCNRHLYWNEDHQPSGVKNKLELWHHFPECNSTITMSCRSGHCLHGHNQLLNDRYRSPSPFIFLKLSRRHLNHNMLTDSFRRNSHTQIQLRNIQNHRREIPRWYFVVCTMIQSATEREHPSGDVFPKSGLNCLLSCLSGFVPLVPKFSLCCQYHVFAVAMLILAKGKRKQQHVLND